MKSSEHWPAVRATADPLGAFVSRVDFALSVSELTGSSLSGRTLAVKDMFDVAGLPTGAGTPQWPLTHPVPTETADAVVHLLHAGARMVGKTVTDELAYSLSGTNVHWGTPVNSAAPDRTCGGSSCGSASAVAGGHADIGLGTDTGGSIRVPASYCGLVGFRPTHGRVSLRGCVPLAPRFDTVGWLTRDAQLSVTVGDVLLCPTDAQPTPPSRLLVWRSALSLVEAQSRTAVDAAMSAFADTFGTSSELALDPDVLTGWAEAFRVLQGADCWRTHGEWIMGERPNLGPGITARFTAASKITAEQEATAEVTARDARQRLDELLGDDGVIVLPASPVVAPLRDATREQKDQLRPATVRLTCAAGLGGLPTLSLPAARSDGLPIGVALIGARNADEQLLRLAARLSR